MNAARSHYRRNFLALIGDYVGFGLALAFCSLSTVIPDFAARLTENKAVVGLLVTVADGAWLLPQLLFANLLLNKPRKKPYVTLGALIGRPALLLYAVALLFGLHREPTLALILLGVVFLLFMGSDALSAVAWFDVLAKAIPENRRGRLVGIAQVVQGGLTFGVGALIAFLLSERGPGFPLDYAAIFALAGLFLFLSLFSWLFVIEPEEEVPAERARWRDYIPQLFQTIAHDKGFRQAIGVRMLAGFELLAFNFYILFARQGLGLPAEVVGVFAVVQTLGNILGSAVLGVVSERAGSHRVIQIVSALNVTAPLLGLILALSRPSGQLVAAIALGGAFLVLGVGSSSFMLGYLNYVLALSPAGRRPMYMGLYNTLGGLLVVMPTVGGWLLEKTSYAVLFAVTAVILALTHVLSWTLPPERRTESPPR